MSGWWVALLGGAGLWLVNRSIRRALSAPRIQVRPAGRPALARGQRAGQRERLFGWFIPATPGAPALVVMHGWGGNAEMMLPLAAPLHAAGYALLLVDARCHGRSDSDTFASLRFAEDIESALDWLAGQPEIDRRLGVVGHSVGAGAALLAASRRPACALSSARGLRPSGDDDEALAGVEARAYWPFGAYVLAYVQQVIGHRFADIAPCNTIARVPCPVLLVHGSEDETVPVAEAAIHAGRASDAVELLLVPGSHDDYRHRPAIRCRPRFPRSRLCSEMLPDLTAAGFPGTLRKPA
jgi:pimeloyl-ACP methyl ester carboxylesterase